MNVLKINKSLTLNIAALVGWVNLVAHIFVSIIVYLDFFQLEKSAPSAIAAYFLVVGMHWVILLGVLGVLVVLVLLELILRLLIQRKLCWEFNEEYKHSTRAFMYFYIGLWANFFTFLTPFICELLFRESYVVQRIIFYGILIILFTSYRVYKLKKSKANHNN